jgi:hypothetical protein
VKFHEVNPAKPSIGAGDLVKLRVSENTQKSAASILVNSPVGDGAARNDAP